METTKRPSLKLVKQLLVLVEKYKLDHLEIPGIKLSKSKHTYSPQELRAMNGAAPVVTTFDSISDIDREIAQSLGGDA